LNIEQNTVVRICLKIIFWGAIPWSLVDHYRCFEGVSCPCLQGRNCSKICKQCTRLYAITSQKMSIHNHCLRMSNLANYIMYTFRHVFQKY
jgi:hypothetical protein